MGAIQAILRQDCEVTNSKISEEMIYNYTRDFPFICEEMHLPISYNYGRSAVENILLDAAGRETVPTLKIHEDKFSVRPETFGRASLCDSPTIGAERAVRFLCKEHESRGLKDRMSREIIQNLEQAKIGIASSTYDIVGPPPI